MRCCVSTSVAGPQKRNWSRILTACSGKLHRHAKIEPDTIEQQEERWWEAEVSRLRGVLLLRQPGTPQAEAETCFQQALEVASRQEAKSLELRAAMSLACLWQQQGKRAEACDLLAPIYGWFTEGFDTADLQEAKALLDALA